MKRIVALWTTVISVLAVSSVLAEDFKLPVTAKKLNGKEIAALYDGSTMKFNAISGDKRQVTGIFTVDFKKNSHTGSYTIGSETGPITGPVRVKGDQICSAEGGGKEHCQSVYVDGANIYEVTSKGVVNSINQKQ